MNPLRWSVPAVCLLCAAVAAKPVEEKYPGGKLKRKYAVDTRGRRDGPYTEYYPNGKVKVRAGYKAGKLDGPYAEFTDTGRKVLTAGYRDGKLDGTLTRYENGKVFLVQIFKDDRPVYIRSLEKIKETLKEINTRSAKKTDKMTAEREAALRRLRCYRYLADVPHAGLVLDERMNREAQAASRLCAKLGRLDHRPPNPGLPKKEYQLGFRGAARSNLGQGFRTLKESVDSWMDDSDPANIDRLGHRRWCLNPRMGKVGFGRTGRFTAMWAHDFSRRRVADFQFICYPTVGLMPVEYFHRRSAWSVVLHPGKYRRPDKSVKPQIYLLDRLLKKVGKPLELDYTNVDTVPFGIPNCIIFRPRRLAVAPGKRYLVEIAGVKRRNGQPAALRYMVVFVSLK
jgi:hypothetical protein